MTNTSTLADANSQEKTVFFKPGERNIFFHILTACNLACRHCYINPEQHGTTALPIDVIEEWLGLFFDKDKKNNLIFLGGEPTLHKDLGAAIKIARQIGYHSITVDTNGYLHHNLLDCISPTDAVLSFSLDGSNAAINDPIRGNGVYETCTKNLKQAVKKGFKVSLIYTVSRMNRDDLVNMPALLQDLKVSRFFIQVIGLRGKSAQAEEQLQLTPQEWLELVPDVARRAASLGIEVIYPKVYLEKDELFQCAGNVAENFFIFPNGRVYQCPLCEDYPIHSYSIKDNKLKRNSGLTENQFFSLHIPEGCVMNKLLQPDNIIYNENGKPLNQISCCLLKQQIQPK